MLGVVRGFAVARSVALSRSYAKLYTPSHEWVEVSNGEAKVGISDHAQGALGDIVFVSLPSVGTDLAKGDTACEVESVKAVGQVYSPLSGKVVGVNDELSSTPDLLNQDAENKGWIFRLQLADAAADQQKGLMNEAAYKTFLKENDH